MKRATFTMTVIYDEDETYANNALDAIEDEIGNIDGIVLWDVTNTTDEYIHEKYDDEVLYQA